VIDGIAIGGIANGVAAHIFPGSSIPQMTKV